MAPMRSWQPVCAAIKKIVRMLIDAGADLDSQNVDGHTALMFAYNGKNQVATLMDKYSDYMKDENDNSTRIIKDALQKHRCGESTSRRG